MTDLTERLRKRADEDAKCGENSKVVADLLRPQIEAFEANEDNGNVYAIRMAVDHRDSVKRDGQYAADLREAATTLETLTQENARLREAGWRDIESAPKDGSAFLVWADGFEWPEVIRWYAHDAELAKEAGEDGYFHYAEEAMHDQFDWEHEVEYWMPLPPAPARKALGGGDES